MSPTACNECPAEQHQEPEVEAGENWPGFASNAADRCEWQQQAHHAQYERQPEDDA